MTDAVSAATNPLSSAPSTPTPRFDAVEEIDILLAQLMADGGGSVESGFRWHDRQREHLLAGAMEFAGVPSSNADVRAGLLGQPGRLRAGGELGLLRGLDRGLVLATAQGIGGRRPDGTLAIELWRALVLKLPGHWPRCLRVREPQDALPWLGYPPACSLPGLLAKFNEAAGYLDLPVLLARLHPIRQCFRVMHRFWRLAPFADHNSLVGWLLGCAFLHSHGYPLLPLAASDREVIDRMLQGGPPRAVERWELRLLEVARSLLREALG